MNATRLFSLACILLCLGCHQDLYDQPRYETMEPSDFFEDGKSARPRVPGTVARGELRENDAFFLGAAGGELVREIPLTIDRALLERGHERYNIYCSMCHAPSGNGNGMIVQRGFRRPPSLHIERLRSAPPGHYFDVITRGIGAMPGYANQVKPHDRWAIIAYIRALQLSQNATLEDVPAEQRASLGEGAR